MYIVSTDYGYEGCEVIGCFQTLEEALQLKQHSWYDIVIDKWQNQTKEPCYRFSQVFQGELVFNISEEYFPIYKHVTIEFGECVVCYNVNKSESHLEQACFMKPAMLSLMDCVKKSPRNTVGWGLS